MAGMVNADTVPLRASMATSVHRLAEPVMTSTATTVWVAPDNRFAVRMTAVRENRSETTPPMRMNSTIGTVRAASTRPSAVAEWVIASTAKVRATGAIADPAVETTRAA
jgi:hypothetical protein